MAAQHYTIAQGTQHVQPIAFFDLDHTVIHESTGRSAMRVYHARGELRARDVAMGLWYGVLHYLDMADAEAIMKKVLVPYVGRDLAGIEAEMQDLFASTVRHNIFAEARREIDTKLEQGYRVVLLTASSAYITRFVAEHLGTDYIATRAQIVAGKFTADLEKPIPYGAGKVHHAEDYSRRHNSSLDQAYFYTDSHSDLPLLQAVGNPVVVNPDFRLARVARLAGWPVLRWGELS